MKHWLTGCVLLLVACAAHAQKIDDPIPLPDFSKDPCGNPYVESQLFENHEGKVMKVVDGRTIQVALKEDEAEAPGILEVRLAGVALDQRRAFSKKAAEHLAQLLTGKSVAVLANFKEGQPRKVTAWVMLKEGPPDFVRSLLAGGWVRYEAPPQYGMPQYTACLYRAAEAAARSKKLGLWQ